MHEMCMCKADVSFCKTVCDSDPKCKGYVKRYSDCHIATTATCPSTNGCEKVYKGVTGTLQEDATCGGKDYDGCFIKHLPGGLIDKAYI